MLVALIALALTPSISFATPKAEVLHWWTSGGEAKSVAVLQKEFSENGGSWTDMPVAGGGGDAAMTALRARVLSGNAPAAVQLKGPSIQEWYEEGALADISAVAKKNNWSKVLPASIAGHMKCEGKWCAAPVNVHRIDWIWANASVLSSNGFGMPKTWDEFNATARALQAKGIIPLAHGGQAWQDATVFEAVAMGLGGNNYYKNCYVDLKENCLRSETTVKVFDQMRKLQGYTDEGSPGRDWNVATGMVIEGKAGFQIMGDWAKGEFTAAGKVPGVDYYCAATPSNNGYLYNVDSFIFYKSSDPDKQAGQQLLAKLMMGKNFQKVFNLYKGSIPARLDVSMDEFDKCAKTSNADIKTAGAKGGLVPSFAHGMAQGNTMKAALQDIITEHFNSDMSSKDAANALADSVLANM